MHYANIGRNISGRPVHLPVTHLSTLLGGLPGAGKSSLLRVILAELSFTDDAAIITCDPKRTELGLWRPRATLHATDPDEITAALQSVVGLIDHRTRWLEDQSLVTWPTSREHPAVVVAVDELAELVHSGESKADDRRAVLLRRIASLGRAAGINLICATQRPSADTIPSYLRALFAYGVAFRVRSIEDAKMVLPGITADDEGPHRLPAGDAHRGRCFVLAEGDTTPVEARVSWCTPEHARRLATENAHLRPTLDLDTFAAPADGAPATSYARATTDADALVLGLLEAGPQTHQAVADAAGMTVDAARKRLQRLADAGRVEHAQGSNVWALA